MNLSASQMMSFLNLKKHLLYAYKQMYISNVTAEMQTTDLVKRLPTLGNVLYSNSRWPTTNSLYHNIHIDLYMAAASQQ